VRDATWVYLDKNTYQDLRNLLSNSYNSGVVSLSENLSGFLAALDRSFTKEHLGDNTQICIEVARDLYCENTNCDIDIDDSAPLSIVDEGVWVGAWVWVNNEELENELEARSN